MRAAQTPCVLVIPDMDTIKEYDAMAAQMTLLADRIKCPTLLAMDKCDELCRPEDGERISIC
jgi:hypothetical protein